MITKNADGSYTVADCLTVATEAQALAMLEDTGAFGLLDVLSIQANRARYTYGMRVVVDQYSNLPTVEHFVEVAA